eukprot:TRINITY_DN7986_c0_g1_i2.p1 TRINITY_DN7986_c0_g1~~TRINITY_DN7986_c0_g1_i2.p1  ORF type:complete len:940 (+),score=201.95 TRINITY_DN7986_c0_g1_i2:50-2869(+)
MSLISAAELSRLHGRTEHIRNFCVMAHVDHGKTTLSDSLIACNGIISSRLAGKVRYMDSLPEEQERLITMKSSAISLVYIHEETDDGGQQMPVQSYLVNLIDSPGHIDFSSEVTAALRVTDGAIVLVDAIEGVCTQTHSVLRQAWNEGIRCCLVINKIDRLITELQMTPLETYTHIRKIIQKVNAIVGSFLRNEMMEAASKKEKVSIKEGDEQIFDWSVEEKDDSNLYFEPEVGNVVFTSAIDGWAFGVEQFANIISKKLGVRKGLLRKTLWGDYFFNPREKKIVKNSNGGKLKPMFVQFVLEPLWQVYDAVLNNDQGKRDKIISSLQLDIPPRELRNRDSKSILQSIMTRWLPLPEAVLGMIVKHLPNPREAQQLKIPKIWPSLFAQSQMTATGPDVSEQKLLAESILNCSKDENAPVVIFVSKIFSVPPDVLPANKRSVSRAQSRITGENSTSQTSTSSTESSSPSSPPPQADQPDAPKTTNIFVAFARIFSGTLKRGSEVHILGPKYDPKNPEKHHKIASLREIYLLMGRELESLESIPAGNVFGIGEVDDLILKTATISSTPLCPAFPMMAFEGAPIVRVAVEPELPSEMIQLEKGLKLLNQSDPCVEVFLQENGEYIIAASGELHMERCLKELQEKYAKITVQASKPSVSFRETIVSEVPKPGGNEVSSITTVNRLVTISVTARPLSAELVLFLEKQNRILRGIAKKTDILLEELEELSNGLRRFGQVGDLVIQESLASFGPKRFGPNMLLFRDKTLAELSGVSNIFKAADAKDVSILQSEAQAKSGSSSFIVPEGIRMSEIYSSIVSGFQLATATGPLCGEPLHGVALIVEGITFHTTEEGSDTDNYGPLPGQVMSAMKAASTAAIAARPTRLVEAIYCCVVEASAEVLGSVYAVLSKRRGRVTKEEMKEGTNVFVIDALLPAVESFGFVEGL